MKKILQVFLYDLLFLIPLIVLFIFFNIVFFLKFPLIWPDEAIFVDTAKNIIENEIMATNLFNDAIPGLQLHSVWYPPFYFYILSFWINFFGSSIESIRILSMIVSFVTVVMIYFFGKILFVNRWFAFLLAFIISIDFYFVQASRVARMDILSFLFLILTFFLFVFIQTKKNYKWYFLPGFFAGLGIITHPLGTIPAIVCGLTILLESLPFKKKIGKLLYFGLPILLCSLVWFLSIKDSLSLFFEQYRLQFLRKDPIKASLVKLFTEEIYWKLTLIVYGGVIVTFIYKVIQKMRSINTRNIWQEKFILVGVFISIVIILWGKEMWYPLYLQPFIAIIIVYLFKNATEKKNDVFFTFVMGIVIFVIGIQTFFLYDVFQKMAGVTYNYHDFTNQIQKQLPKKASVFLATIPDPYFDLQFNKNLTLYEFPTVPVTEKAYHNLLDKTDYIVINILPQQYWFIEEYVKNNVDNIVVVKQPGGYSAKIIKLKDKSKRR